MWEIITTTLSNLFTSGEIWAVIIKLLITAIITVGLSFVGTCIGKIIVKNKESKIYKYAEVCVRTAEQKFPNEGKKMGPEKMEYVLDQLSIKFPRIKENDYLHNIAEAAVRELNKELKKEAAAKEFEGKYGEKPLAVLDNQIENSEEEIVQDSIMGENSTEKNEQTNTISDTQPTQKKVINKLKSF